MEGGQLIEKGNSYPNPGGKLITRSLCPVEEFMFITGRGLGYPAIRADLVMFAEGKQASSDFLNLLRGTPG